MNESRNNLQIVTEVADTQVISREDIDRHLVEKLIPYVTLQYEKTTKVNATLSQVIADMISAVEKTKSQEKVLQGQGL